MKIAKTPYKDVISQLKILDNFKPFEIQIIGTPPLEINIESSDIDFICHYTEAQLNDLKKCLRKYKNLDQWALKLCSKKPKVYICTFSYLNWDVEIYCSTQPISEQYGYRHFQVEKRLLKLANTHFKQHILMLKQKGLKTEPAFAIALSLNGNPYIAMSDLFFASDQELLTLLKNSNFLN
ncbi:DUF4269 domain-containing protein [Acinetobacter haemolyticus]|uniref:DUF4269 domain-containing protein n=1 Tax=Acinetobacter haemolyticus TaxID=29430 RepID=A0AAJ2YSJ1_ACIHA|nr:MULTISPECIES: DUF4269 domain-containing protein [Acinetobacter]ATZ66950.1 hypothetical protein BSR56_06035 [Acinetobacter haemolyticus]MCU4393934.1 DUF4269 domain-containing protein [Acinetobacter parvus]NAR17930.1 DUF4269 domain-containing protein [Acinetobacter haemolyticus]NAR30574.1 DUF4269 domain-containing protein [Acinetobacter haemolyticus]NAR35894.1 DUF4269 domain-containing protein [Acinetobacter haemolyticus]